MNHLDNLEKILGNFENKKILDIGAGKGEFLLECAKRGLNAEGVEINEEKIKIARTTAAQTGLNIRINPGNAENLAFPSESFDFVNLGEVIEHVSHPEAVLKEVYRVLKSSGSAYVSVHNRFGMYDTHFHVYFLGWFPRAWSNWYLGLFGKHKDYLRAVDLQNIKDMHYFTFGNFNKLCGNLGFRVLDARVWKIENRFHGILGLVALAVYKIILRPLYVSTFHIVLFK